jgi:hypothetical protein
MVVPAEVFVTSSTTAPTVPATGATAPSSPRSGSTIPSPRTESTSPSSATADERRSGSVGGSAAFATVAPSSVMPPARSVPRRARLMKVLMMFPLSDWK